MNILITGGCGYVGNSLIFSLLKYEEVKEIIIYDNLAKKRSSFFFGDPFFNAQKIKFIKGDILDNYKLDKILENVDVVIHLAAIASTPFANTDSNKFDQVNNWGTSILCGAIEKSNRVKRLIYLSSISVYGNTMGERVNEESVTVPKTFYGISKLRGEKHVSRLSTKIDTFIFRVGNIFGFNPCIRLESVINRFIFDAQVKSQIEIHGDGNQKRSFVSVNWLSEYISKACFKSQHLPIQNLTSYNLSINEIANEIRLHYPQIDVIHLDQHLEMRSITAESKFEYIIPFDSMPIGHHIEEIKRKFRF